NQQLRSDRVIARSLRTPEGDPRQSGAQALVQRRTQPIEARARAGIGAQDQRRECRAAAPSRADGPRRRPAQLPGDAGPRAVIAERIRVVLCEQRRKLARFLDPAIVAVLECLLHKTLIKLDRAPISEIQLSLPDEWPLGTVAIGGERDRSTVRRLEQPLSRSGREELA